MRISTTLLALSLIAATAAILYTIHLSKSPRLDEAYAARVVKDHLKLTGSVFAQQLKGGLSNAQLFIVTSGTEKYVIRFLLHKTAEKREQEITCLTAASQGDYGPHVYFASSTEGIAIMEYLKALPITDAIRASPLLYNQLGQLLRTMHSAPPLTKTTNVFSKIQNRMLPRVKARYKNSVILDTIEHAVEHIKNTVEPFATWAPCHNDLNPNNIIFVGTACKAIDYESAAQADPYFDVATIIAFYCFSPDHEKIVVTTYLKRPPTRQEEARLYLMKQIVFINWALGFLNRVGEQKQNTSAGQNLADYRGLVDQTFYENFLKSCTQGKNELEDPEQVKKMASALLDRFFAGIESEEFNHALKTLGGFS